MIMLMMAILTLSIGLLAMNGEVQTNGSYTAYVLPASVFPESQDTANMTLAFFRMGSGIILP